MRNLFLFLLRNYFVILFLLLQGFNFWLIVQYNKFHQANFLTSLQEISGSTYEFITNFKSYLYLQDTNKKLAAENAVLKTFSKPSFMGMSDDLAYFEDTLFQRKFVYRPARVVNSTETRSKNYITLNRGLAHGIKPEQAVFNSDGIIGIVKDVSHNFSTVVSVLNVEASTSVKHKKTNYFGLLIWDGGSIKHANLTDIPNHVPIVVGDTIVTRGLNSAFPQGIMAGTVESVQKIEGDPFYQIRVLLSTEFKNLDYVYVVEDVLMDERKKLEENLP